MKIKDEYILKSMLGKKIIFSTDASGSGAVHTVNGTGEFLWNALKNGASEEELPKLLCAEYDVDPETAKKDVKAFIEALKAKGITEE